MSVVRLPVITNSQMKTFRRCMREHFYRYILGFVALFEVSHLRFGTLVHLALEAWWRSTGDRLADALAALDVESDPYERIKAEVMIRGYHARWNDEPYEVISVEAEFRTPLLNPETGAPSRTYELGGKLDVIVRKLTDGLVYKIEHKTASQDIGVGSTYWKRLTLDPQISTYYEGARSLGHDVAGCVYDVLGKPGQKPSQVALTDADGVKIVHDANGERVRTKDGKKWRQTSDTELGYVLQTRPETAEEYGERLTSAIAEDPDRYFQRGTIVRLEDDEREAAFDRWQTAQQMREAERTQRHPRNPDGCERYGRMCEFFEVCCGNASLDDPTQFRKLDSVHQELSAATAA